MIDKFRDTYWFLSNFYPCKILYKKREWPTAEHLFQVMKTTGQRDRMKIRKCTTPGQAKRIGKQVELRPGWDEARLSIMHTIVFLKFLQNSELKKKLLGTGTQMLIEGNYWHDNFWGDCKCKKCSSIVGENHLGLLLMEVRNELL